MTTDLVPINGSLAEQHDRRAALEQLAQEAESAQTPQEAREIMFKAQAIASVLQQVKAPWEESWLAGKASVLAARRLGRLLSQLNTEVGYRPSDMPELFDRVEAQKLRDQGLSQRETAARLGVSRSSINKAEKRGWTSERNSSGCIPSERGAARRELGISHTTCATLIRLSEIKDPDFQRYIQIRDKIPSMSGALIAAGHSKKNSGRNRSWHSRKRNKANVQIPPNPSIDEAYSLIVRALGHLSGSAPGGTYEKLRAISASINALYEAEDLLKPFRGGYVS